MCRGQRIVTDAIRLPGSGGAPSHPSRRWRAIVSTSGSSGIAGIILAAPQGATT
jgi:hypothetical protein